MAALDSYDRILADWDGESESRERFAEILSRRNAVLQDVTPVTDFRPERRKSARNQAFVDARRVSSPRRIAFHVGAPHQRRLHSLVHRHTGAPNNMGVFFSTDVGDVLHYLGCVQEDMAMVYFLDTRTVQGARLQVTYNGCVLSRYDMDDLYDRNRSWGRVGGMREHVRLNRAWIEKYTVPFDTDEQRSCTGYLIVPDPIQVAY